MVVTNLFGNKAKLNPTAMGSTPAKRNDDWVTPQPLFNWLDGIFVFDCDVFASELNHKCARFYTKENNALKQTWLGGSHFMNPPYSLVSECMDYAWKQSQVEVVALVPVATEAGWWRTAFERIKGSRKEMTVSYETDHRGKDWMVLEGEFGCVWFSPYRIQFIDPAPPKGKKRTSNPKGSTIFVFDQGRTT